MRISTEAIYLTDNGRALCGEHLGVSAKTTGRDISGQRIHKVTPEDARYSREQFGDEIVCEMAHSHRNPCTRKASLLVEVA